MNTKTCIIFIFAITCGITAYAQNKYYDPTSFYSQDADCRSDDGLVRAIVIRDEDDNSIISLQYLDTKNNSIIARDTNCDYSIMYVTPLFIYSIKTNSNGTVYLYIYSESNYQGGWAWESNVVKCYKPDIMNKTLIDLSLFKTAKNKALSTIKCEWRDNDNIQDPFLSFLETDDVDYRGITYDRESSTLYVPLLVESKDINDMNIYTNRYLAYRFDGDSFVYKGIVAPYWLHSSLKDYKQTVYCFCTKDYLIQIDKLADGTYRYAAWKGGDELSDMKRKPDLVINNGVYVKNNGFSFTNNGHTYIFDDNNATLVVKKRNKIILKQDIAY